MIETIAKVEVILSGIALFFSGIALFFSFYCLFYILYCNSSGKFHSGINFKMNAKGQPVSRLKDGEAWAVKK
jgi:hypothetical protein